MKANASLEEVTDFIRQESGGAFTWDEVARYREMWKGRLVLKGILHPQSAAKAIQLGVDGVVVSNHGGRQIDCLPAAIDMLQMLSRKFQAESLSCSTQAFGQA